MVVYGMVANTRLLASPLHQSPKRCRALMNHQYVMTNWNMGGLGKLCTVVAHVPCTSSCCPLLSGSLITFIIVQISIAQSSVQHGPASAAYQCESFFKYLESISETVHQHTTLSSWRVLMPTSPYARVYTSPYFVLYDYRT